MVLVSGLAPGAELLCQGDTSAARNLLAPEGRVFGVSRAIVCLCPGDGALLPHGAPLVHTAKCDFA